MFYWTHQILVKDTIFKHLIDNNLLSDDQFGFCSGRSCTTQLLSTIYDWFSELDNNVPVDAIYLDFRKAFDAVPNLRLIQGGGHAVSTRHHDD